MIDFKQHKTFILWELIPLLGSILFLFLYFIATLYYPGGNYLNKSSHGFSWTQNYWCNLLSENSISGQHNPAKPIAFIAMAVLCLTISFFWYEFPKWAGFKAGERLIIQASGFISMAISALIFTSLHDTIINVAGIFGLIALAGTIIGLKKLGWTKLFYMGLGAVVLIALNNLLYYEKDRMHYLAMVQKITFFYFLVWICLINVRWVSKTATNTDFAK
jgi:hypothetical protein